MRNSDGTFGKGNPGRPKGAIGEKAKQWEELGESIVSMQSQHFNEFMLELWEDKGLRKRLQAANLYLQVLEYFKPKLSRAEVDQNNYNYSRPIEITKTYEK